MTKKHYWTVLQCDCPNTPESINLNRTHIYMASESYWECLKVMFSNKVHGCRRKDPIICWPGSSIMKLSQETLYMILAHKAELSSDCWDDDYSQSFRDVYKDELFRRWRYDLDKRGRLDFRKIDAGVEIHSYDVRTIMKQRYGRAY